MSTSQAIRQRIAAHPVGKIFTPSLFAGLGSRASIDQALMRLAQAGEVERIGQGLYTTPKANRFGFKSMPTPEAIAQTIAANDGATIEIHGAEAARRFGFSTQVPAQPTFHTTGSSRRVKLGKLTIHLVHTAPRKLILAGRAAGQALLALWYLGRHEVTSATFQQLAAKLPPSEFKALQEARPAMPAWMQSALHKYEAQRHD